MWNKTLIKAIAKHFSCCGTTNCARFSGKTRAARPRWFYVRGHIINFSSHWKLLPDVETAAVSGNRKILLARWSNIEGTHKRTNTLLHIYTITPSCIKSNQERFIENIATARAGFYEPRKSFFLAESLLDLFYTCVYFKHLRQKCTRTSASAGEQTVWKLLLSTDKFSRIRRGAKKQHDFIVQLYSVHNIIYTYYKYKHNIILRRLCLFKKYVKICSLTFAFTLIFLRRIQFYPKYYLLVKSNRSHFVINFRSSVKT